MPVAHQNTATRTPLFSRHQPGGTYAYAPIRRFPGEVFFVSSTDTTRGADDTGHGRSPEAPFLTLNYAFSQCTANQGDVIYLKPGHIETVMAAAGLALDVAGVHVIGVGNGTIQPIIRVAGTVQVPATVTVTAANITVENVNWQAGLGDVATAIIVTATDFTIRKCRFTEQAVDLNALIWIQMPAYATAARLTVEDCLVYAPDASNTHFINFSDTGTGHVVRRNVLHGDWSTMAIGGAGVITYANISDNYIYNFSNTVDGCLNFANAATGVMANNMVGNNAAVSNQNVATGMAKSFNYGVDLIGGDVQGIPDPAMA